MQSNIEDDGGSSTQCSRGCYK